MSWEETLNNNLQVQLRRKVEYNMQIVLLYALNHIKLTENEMLPSL